jgi:undecaprenyl phosphate-alpha-L-ara4N flippase subunit ArnE
MVRKRPLTLTVFLLILFTNFLETIVQFCFKKTALAQRSVVITNIADALHFIFVAASNPFLWFALFAVFLLFCIWIIILSKLDLSVAIPVASLSYITIPLVSVIFLKERIPFSHWIGILFIALGVILVSLSSHHQEVEA